MANDPLSAADHGDFLSDAEAIEKESMPWQARATLYVLVALLLAATTWASFAKVDRIVVGRGKLITTTPTIVVQPLEPSMSRSIDVQVSRLRHRLGDDPRDPELIKTVRGEGYVLAVPAQPG